MHLFGWTSFACLCHVTFVDFVEGELSLAFPLGVDASLVFLLLFLGGMDIRYTSATIATSRLCEVHHKPKRPRLTTHSEPVQA